MFGKLLRRRRSDRFRHVTKRQIGVEPLEDRRLLATTAGFVGAEFETELQEMDVTSSPVPMPVGSDPGFSYVDANDNQIYDMGTDVALVAGEVEDGFFDTQIPEGGYTSIVPGAGLVINGDPISAPNVTYRANGTLVVNTDLDAADDIRLVSRHQSVILDDPALTAGDDVIVSASKDIISTDDLIQAAGNNSLVRLWAGHDILLQGTVVEAVNGQSDIHIRARQNTAVRDGIVDAGRHVSTTALQDVDVSGTSLYAGVSVTLRANGDATAVSSALDAGTSVVVRALGNVRAANSTMYAGSTISVWALRTAAAPGSNLVAGRTVSVRANGDVDVSASIVDADWNVVLWSLRTIDASGSIVEAGWRVALWAKWRVDVNGATLEADREVELRSARGKVFAMDSFITSLANRNGEVELDAAIDVVVKRAWIEASRKLTLSSRDDIFARESTLLASGDRGRVDIQGKNWVSVWSGTVRAYEQIAVRSLAGDADARRASVAIVTGSTLGDIRIQANRILVQAAEIVSPDVLQLIGTQVGTPLFIGAGTRDRPILLGSTPGLVEFHGPFDIYERDSGTLHSPHKDWGAPYPDKAKWFGQQKYQGTLLSVDDENATLVWSEDNRSFRLEGNGTHSYAVVCPPKMSEALFKSPIGSATTHSIELQCGTVSCKVISIDGKTNIGGYDVSYCTAYRTY